MLGYVAEAIHGRYWRMANLEAIREFLKAEMALGRYRPTCGVEL